MAAGEEAGFRDFVHARWDALLRTAYALTGDHGHAEDLLQSALVNAHRRWSRIERTDAPEAYVRRIMVNLNISWWRHGRWKEIPTDDLPEPADPHTDEHGQHEVRDVLWSAVLALPPRMRATLVLRYFEDLSESETADVLGCSIGSVKSQTSRALARLRAALDNETENGATAVTAHEIPRARRS